jgi:predicted DNA-binding transcriptional regulator AlpA
MSRHFILTAVRPVLPSTLHLEFADGANLTLDLSDTIQSFTSLARLKNPEVFATACLAESGRVVVWDNNNMLELAADNLRARAIEQAGGVSHEFIWNWMAKNHLTLDTAAAAIGVSRRMLAYYRSGKNPVPRTVALACIGWEVGEQQAA